MGSFFKKCTFLRLQSFISQSIKYPINLVFSVEVCIFLMKRFSSWSIFHWSFKKCLLTISIATVVKETNFFIKVMHYISPNYPWENRAKKIKSAEEKLSPSCILGSLAKAKDPSDRGKIHQQVFGDFYNHLLDTCWVDVIYLTCLIFLKSPW